jgi:type IV secretory pathway VirB6-like protein
MIKMFQRLLNEPTTARKFFAALVGAFLVAATQGLLPAGIAAWAVVVVAFATAVGVYAIPNEKDGVG